MSLLKDLGIIAGMTAVLFGAGFMLDRSAYKRGVAVAEAACAAEREAAYAAQLAELVRLNSQTAEAVARSTAEATIADQALDAQLTSTVKLLETLRAQTITVGADCRRPYDAVRMYQQAASGPAALGRDGETSPGLPALGYDPLPSAGDAGG